MRDVFHINSYRLFSQSRRIAATIGIEPTFPLKTAYWKVYHSCDMLYNRQSEDCYCSVFGDTATEAMD